MLLLRLQAVMHRLGQLLSGSIDLNKLCILWNFFKKGHTLARKKATDQLVTEIESDPGQL